MKTSQTAYELMRELRQSADDIDAEAALALVTAEIEDGLARRGGLPMTPSLRWPGGSLIPRGECLCIDLGGTALKSARVRADGAGTLRLSDMRESRVPGLDRALGEEEFFDAVARAAGIGPDTETVCVSFSYYMEPLPGADARILAWSKELKLPPPSGMTVAEHVRRAAGNPALRVLVANDSVAATLGCLGGGADGCALLGLIVGTGFNICWRDDGGMLYNTEAGDSRAFRPGLIDERIDRASACPGAAPAEKLCSGVYLEQIVRGCVAEAMRRGLIPYDEGLLRLSLAEYGALLSAGDAESELVAGIVREAERRSAKIAAVCAAALLRRNRCGSGRVLIAAEGSVVNRMDGYKALFLAELGAIPGGGLETRLVSAEQAGLRGAARLTAL